MTLPIAIALLAGGQSSRLGIDKAFIRVRTRPLIEDILERLAGLGAGTFIVTNRPESFTHLGQPLYTDIWPAGGVLGGVYTALVHSPYPHTLCLACDLPFVERALLEYLAELAAGADAVVPRRNGAAEPLHAVYAQTCCEPARVALAAGERRIVSFYPAVRVRFVDEPEIERFDPHHRSFFNINTPADLETARRLAAET